jgi:hypothetical protein
MPIMRECKPNRSVLLTEHRLLAAEAIFPPYEYHYEKANYDNLETD